MGLSPLPSSHIFQSSASQKWSLPHDPISLACLLETVVGFPFPKYCSISCVNHSMKSCSVMLPGRPASGPSAASALEVGAAALSMAEAMAEMREGITASDVVGDVGVDGDGEAVLDVLVGNGSRSVEFSKGAADEVGSVEFW